MIAIKFRGNFYWMQFLSQSNFRIVELEMNPTRFFPDAMDDFVSRRQMYNLFIRKISSNSNRKDEN